MKERAYEGWFPFPRGGAQEWLWDDAEILRAWATLHRRAQTRPGSHLHRGAVLDLEVGQLATTLQAFSKTLGWSRDRVRHFFALLQKRKELVVRPKTFDPNSDTWIDTRTDRGTLLLTLVNHPFREKAQGKSTPESTLESTPERENRHQNDTRSTAEPTPKSTPESTPKSTPDSAPFSHGVEPSSVVATDTKSDTESDTRIDTPPRAHPPQKSTRLNNNNNTPTREPSGERGVRGEIERVLGAVHPDRGREGSGGREPRPADPRHPLFGLPHPRRALDLLATIGMGRAVSRSISVEISIGRILDVVVAARTRDKPGGWARTAFEEGFEVPRANGEDLKALVRFLEEDQAATAQRYGPLAGRGRQDPELARRPGEGEDEHLRRVNERLIERRRKK